MLNGEQALQAFDSLQVEPASIFAPHELSAIVAGAAGLARNSDTLPRLGAAELLHPPAGRRHEGHHQAAVCGQHSQSCAVRSVDSTNLTADSAVTGQRHHNRSSCEDMSLRQLRSAMAHAHKEQRAA